MIPWLVLLQATLSIAVAGPASAPEYLPLWVARSEGYFAEEHLTVSLEAARAEVPAAEALARGRADLAATSLDAAILTGATGGVPPKLVFGLTETPAVALLVPAQRKHDIRALGDLVGKTIGVPAPGTPAELALLATLANAGIQASQIKTRSYGERGLAGAIQSGEVAAGMLGDPYATRLIEDGQAVALADLRKRDERERWIGEPWVHSAVFVRADTPLGPAVFRPLSRALLRALERTRTASPEELQARLPAAVVGFPEDFRARLLGARQVFIPNGLVTSRMLDAGIAAMRSHGPIPAKVHLPRNRDSLLLIQSLQDVLDSARR